MKYVSVETDHKPVVSLFGDKFLDRLPPRIQGFKLRLQRFQHKMSQFSGSKKWTAEALTLYNAAIRDESDETRVCEIKSYVGDLVQPQGTNIRLETLRKDQQNNATE
jgi:hypothetical protein